MLVDGEGKVVFGLYGPCPDDFPTALRAELRAVLVLLKHAIPPLVVHVDCQTVVDGWDRGQEWCDSSCRPDADLWRELWRLVDDVGPGVTLVKCKGHATDSDVAAGKATLFEKVANDNADHFARAGATIAEQQCPNGDLIRGYQAAQRWYHWLATLAAEMPKDTQDVVVVPNAPQRVPRQEVRLHESMPHALEKSSDRWTCTVCRLHVSIAATMKCKKAFYRSACRGDMAARAVANPVEGRPHVLFLSGSVTWCKTCGRYSSKRTNALAREACAGRPQKGSEGPLARLKAGIHPKQADLVLPRAMRLSGRVCQPYPAASSRQFA